MNCVEYEKDKEIVVKVFFSVLLEIKIGHYYIIE